MKTLSPTLALNFERDDHSLVQASLGALVDMTLARHGASIARLEAAYLAVDEVVGAITASGNQRGRISTVHLIEVGARSVIHICHSLEEVVFEKGAHDLVLAAFGECNQQPGIVELLVNQEPASGARL